MLHTVTYRALAIAACGLLLACQASALTIGAARGAVLVGRPLELSIPVTMDGADSDGPCATAEVFYGDQKITRPPTVRWEPSGRGQGSVRVSSALPVDEPMVTVALRVGCGQTATRRYVLLSELPPNSEVITPLARSGPAPAQARVAATPAAPAASPSRSPLRTPRRAPQAAAPVAAAPPAPAPKARKPAVALAQPRLRVEPVDLTTDRDPTLRLTSELSTQVSTDPRNREAAAAMWAALQKGPEESLQDAVRLQGVERELKSLRDVTKQNAEAVVQMRSQVDQARGERNYVSLALLVLGALLAALLGWLAWRWHHANRVARVGRWFEANGQAAPAAAPAAAGEASVAAQAEDAAADLTAAAGTGAVLAANAWSPSQDFQASRGGTVRMVGVDELIDVHDKADFFLSIGETDQAIAVLEGHVHDQVETSALAWMDLLELYHSLGKQVEYERLRNEFCQRFAAQVPDFEHFAQPSASLENYSRALSRIVALWPARRVLDVIEESIFRKPGLPGSEPFSLEAYRELVLLYHVAREVAPPEQRRDPRPSNFSDTSLQPLNMLQGAEAGEQDLLMVPPSSARLGVDIDLSEGEELPALDFDMSDYDHLPQDASSRRR